ncbi:hypothetical protein DRO55_06740 [Candidatus Bathyarchaeota archaeon]|nr:MAG: hypothetical protein DRO55_06740 [Candidatus Bathyarchaeota archaeon]
MGCYSLNAADAVGVAVALSLLGYAVGNLIRFLPGVSRSTRASAASMVDYAVACLMFAAFAGGIVGLLDSVITAFVPAPYLEDPASCKLVEDFFQNSVWKAAAIIGGLGGIAAALPFIPVVGAAISIAFTVAVAPLLIILGSIILPTSALNYVIVAAFKWAGPFLFPAGVAAIATPNRLLKGLGAVLISFAIVFYTALPIIPYAVISIMGWSGPEEFLKTLGEYESQIESLKESPTAGIFDVFNITKFYETVIDWAVACLLTAVFVAIAFAAARGLSQSLGGVSASV